MVSVTMDVLLLLLVLSPISVLCQTLQESGPGLVKPSQQLEMTCTVSGFELTTYDVNWIRQAPGKGLEWIGTIWTGGGTAYSDSMKSRTTISKDNSKKQVRLQINNMEAADTGVYYCARSNWNYFDIWGNGQYVAVSSVDILVPHVFPLVAVGLTTDSTYTFACLVNRFFPQPASVTWSTNTGESVTGVKDIRTPLTGDPPAYNLLSQVSVSNTEWKSGKFQCKVSHYSTSITKTITEVCNVVPEAPSVHLSQGTCPESNYGDVEITCQVYNLTSQDATVKWYINEQKRDFPKNEMELGKSPFHLFALQSTVTIKQSEWNNGVRVKCHVTDPKTGKTAEDTIKKCSENFNCLGIHVFMVPPSIEDLYVHNTARIACVASNLKDTSESYTFSWSHPGATTPNVQTEDPELKNNGTYSVTSVLTVSPNVWHQQTEFTCVFRHSRLTQPIITTIRKERGTIMSQPVVLVFPPSDQELARKEEYTLLCICHNHSPKDIYISWTENDMEVSRELFVNSEPKLEVNRKTYFTTSKLVISTSAWESGYKYGCVVGHETLPLNFIRRFVDKYAEIKISIEDKEGEEDIENPWEISTTFMSLFVLSLVYSVTVTLFKVK